MTTPLSPYTPASLDVMQRYVRRAISGHSEASARLRAQVLEFARDPLADRLLILGPYGSGKSALARHAAFLKWIAPMKRDYAEAVFENVRFRGPGMIEPVQMTWFVEISLTGLLEQAATAQLFGTAKKAFTGVDEREGVFEQAMFGRDRNNPPAGAQVTGGIVFLDEVGDLPESLQPQLLPVLSGGTFYRAGGEGLSEYAQNFEGIVIAATWRDLGTIRFRPDLLSRLAGFVVDVPSLSARIEDLDEIIDELQRWAIENVQNRVKRLQMADPRSVDREGIGQLAGRLHRLSDDDRSKIKRVNWDQYGNLRALRKTVEQTMAGYRPVSEIIQDLRPISASDSPNTQDAGPEMLRRLLKLPEITGGLLANVKEIEYERRLALQQLLKQDPSAVELLARRIGMTEQQLKEQAHQLSRRRLGEKE